MLSLSIAVEEKCCLKEEIQRLSDEPRVLCVGSIALLGARLPKDFTRASR